MAEVERKVGISLILKDKMSKGLKKAGKESKSLIEKAKGVNISFKSAAIAVTATAAAITGAAIAAFKFTENVAAAGDEMFFMSQKTGVSVEELSQFKFIAEQSGAQAMSFQNALKTVSKKVVMGDKNLEKYGLTLTDTTGKTKSAKQLFMESADIIAKQTSSTEKAAAANMLLGGAGLELIPMLELGSAGMEELAAKADKLGITMSHTGAAMSNEFNNQLGSVQDMMSGVSRDVGESMMPAFIRAFNVIQDELHVFMPVFETVSNGISTGAKFMIKAVSVLGQTFVAVVGTIKIAWEGLILGWNTLLAGVIGTINATIRGMNMLLPATMQVDEVYNAFSDTMDENIAEIKETASQTGEMVVAIQRMENALSSGEKMTFKAAETTKKHTGAIKTKTKSLEELKAIEDARAARKQSAEDAVLALQAEQQNYRLAMQIKMTNELAEAETAATEKRVAESQATVQAYSAVGAGAANAFMSAYNAAEEGQDRVGAGLKALGAMMIDTALEVMQTEVTAYAATAAAGAAKSQSGIPVIGPALAAAAAAAMFGLVRGFIAMGMSGGKGMAQGGFVTGGTRGRDSVPIMAMPGEYVLTTNQVRELQAGGSFGMQNSGARSASGGGGSVNIQLTNTIPADKAELKKFIRQNVVPALKELKGQGMF